MSEAKKLNLGGIALPLDIEALEALPLAPGGTIQFDFAYRYIRFAARYQHDEAGGTLKLVGDVAPLPFTAESPAARAGLGHIVVSANDVLGPTFRFADGRIVFGASAPVPAPITATHVISTVASLLIPARPYLDLIAVYVRPPLAPAPKHESALRPEWRRRPPTRVAAKV